MRSLLRGGGYDAACIGGATILCIRQLNEEAFVAAKVNSAGEGFRFSIEMR